MAVDWEIVKIALEASQTNEAAAEKLLLAAIEQKGCNGECKPGCCGAGSNEQDILITAAVPDKAVVYGRDSYTDQHDPRQPNGRKHEMTNNLVTGIHLTVHVKPERRYRVSNFYLIDESAASGQTVCKVKVLGKDGREQPADVRLATGYAGQDDKFDDYLVAGNAGNEFVITNKFFPPALAPLAIVILENGRIASDVAGNIGLPMGHHVSFYAELTER